MKKYKRRRFLLFATQASASALIGSLSKCATPPQQKTKNKKEMNELKEEIIKLVKAGKVIKLKWDCGGDEIHLTVLVDDKEVNYEDKIFEALDVYVMNQLNLPDAGEFAMEGGGTIIEEDGEIYVEYESMWTGYADESGDWVNTNEKEDAYSGKKELFKN